MSEWRCGPKCPCWRDGENPDWEGFDSVCRHPNFTDDDCLGVRQGEACDWELGEWVARDGELQDEIADLQQEQAAIRALIAARRAAEGEQE